MVYIYTIRWYVYIVYLRSSAESSSHGRFVAASTKTWLSLAMSPSICTSSSVFIRRDPSPSPASPREPIMESISSIKMVEGAWWRA